jgi:predicted naringenin-chalcone synthase
LGIGTATPASISQSTCAQLAEEFAGLSKEGTDGQRAWLKRVFLRSGVEQRGTVLAGMQNPAPPDAPERVRDFYSNPEQIGPQGPGTAVRMRLYADAAPPLAARACREALAAAAMETSEITHLVTVSCTGFFAPGLDVELITRLELSPDIRRTHIGFMGCHAAFNALAMARDIVRSTPSACVLVCCVELCTLHFAYGWDPEKLVANALFADGAAACVVAADDPEDLESSGIARWRLLDSASLLLGGSREAMTWKIGDHGFAMTLSATLPALINAHVRDWCGGWLAGRGLDIAEVERWAIHPGGPRILNAVRDALQLSPEHMLASEGILRNQGNMSSTTVLFVLQQLLHSSHAGDRCVAIGFGPGLTAEGMLLERV